MEGPHEGMPLQFSGDMFTASDSHVGVFLGQENEQMLQIRAWRKYL
jgi:hypothetical protein